MNKKVLKILGVISAGIIGSSLIGGISTAADIYPGAPGIAGWDVNIEQMRTQKQPKSTDSSIYVYNHTPDCGVYVNIYGTNRDRYTWRYVHTCNRYWETLQMENLYFQPNTAALVRNYVNENKYRYAILRVNPDGDHGSGIWKPDVYQSEIGGFTTIN